MARREFPHQVYNAIMKRAFDEKLGFICEGCGLRLGKKPWHIDHTIADALQVDKSAKLTAEDGKLLGVDCCHMPKTKNDVKRIAKAKRVEKKYLGVPKPKSGRGFSSRFGQKMDGTVYDKQTGEIIREGRR